MKFLVWSDRSKNRKLVEAECSPGWIKEWNDVYLAVPQKLIELQGYCRDDGKKRPTRQGLRRFLGSIIRKDCPMREAVRRQPLIEEPRPNVERETRVNYLQQMKERLAR